MKRQRAKRYLETWWVIQNGYWRVLELTEEAQEDIKLFYGEEALVQRIPTPDEQED